MLQTELNIGSDLTPHYNEAWTESVRTMIYQNGVPITDTTHVMVIRPGKYGRPVERWTPEIPFPYDTYHIFDGRKVSIQDDCGIYPMMTIYPQDGSKYHLEITGNHTASLDISVGDAPYNLHYETSGGIVWDVEFSMSQQYHVDITGRVYGLVS